MDIKKYDLVKFINLDYLDYDEFSNTLGIVVDVNVFVSHGISYSSNYVVYVNGELIPFEFFELELV